MRTLVVYSSRTGNTKKVARAIFDILPEEREIFPVEKAPPAIGYNFVAIGFWVDKGQPDHKAARYMKTVQGATVALFGTLGAKPDSDHARDCIRRAKELVSQNSLLGSFICQGRIDPAIVQEMRKNASHIHPMTPERIANLEAAKSHPDETDLENARSAFRQMVQAFEEAVTE